MRPPQEAGTCGLAEEGVAMNAAIGHTTWAIPEGAVDITIPVAG
jgi:hypothetical protein